MGMKTDNHQRMIFFDNVKATLILFVVLGHLINILFRFSNIDCVCVSKIWQFIYLFHMPCFCLISGYFSKRKILVSKLLTQLLVPYTIFNCLYFIMHRNLTFPLFPDSAMWYLFVLCIWKMILPIIKKVKHAFAISCIVAAIYDYISIAGQENAFSKAIRFFPFFLLGYYLTEQQIEKIRSKKCKSLYLILTIAVLGMWLFAHKIGISYTDEMMFAKTDRITFDKVGLTIWIMRMISAVLGLIISITLISWMTNRKLWITSFGQHTMTIYLLHYLPVIQMALLIIPISNNCTLRFGICVIVAIAMCYVFSRKIVVDIYNIFIYRMAKLIMINTDEGDDTL